MYPWKHGATVRAMPQMMSFAGEPEGSSAVSGPTSFGAAWPRTSLSWWMAFGQMPGEKMVNVLSRESNYWPWGIFITQQTKRDTAHQYHCDCDYFKFYVGLMLYNTRRINNVVELLVKHLSLTSKFSLLLVYSCFK